MGGKQYSDVDSKQFNIGITKLVIGVSQTQSPENITVARSLTGGRLVKQWKFGGRFVKIEI